ncbi:MAG: GNAT family N-acetyltransferase [Oscillospiraceae bacterium]|nr:GNAT family N-acetyltransferase [Oscillospiraceae bacterium]
MTHKGAVTLETERLTLRRFTLEDAEALHRNVYSDPEVMRFAFHDVSENLKQTQSHVRMWRDHFGEKDKWNCFAVTLKAGSELIGTIDFAETDADAKSAEVGYTFGKAWWNQGYATEALTAVLGYCFEVVGLQRVWATHNPLNPASGRVLQKAGMLHEGTFRKNKVRKGVLVDTVQYAILAEDYFGKTDDTPKGYIMDLRKVVGHRPLIQVGASIIVDNGQGEILLERRKDNGTWEYPAGSMELGESMDETAKRELFEETGLTAQKLELYDFLHTDTPRSVYPSGDVVYNVIARYVCTEWTGELRPQASEVTELRWFPFDALPEEFPPHKVKNIEQYLAWRSSYHQKV